MTDGSFVATLPPTSAVDQDKTGACRVSLGSGCVGLSGRVVAIRQAGQELERVLLEIGLVEGARVTLLHEGPVGGDPIALMVDDMRVALRRREAEAVIIQAVRRPPADGSHG